LSPVAIIPRAEQTEIERILASATSEERLVLQVAAAAAKGQWRASAWLLERRFPERWAARPRVQAQARVEPPSDDPFAEVDELARRRRARLHR
jgi:hypothetical protein